MKIKLDGEDSRSLQPGALNIADVIFMVVAVSAPLGVVVALQPIAFAYGNGAGVPGAYVITTIALFLFALGYVKIIPYIRNAGAFYAYIAAGLGKGLGLASAYVAALSYAALSASTLAAGGFFAMDIFRNLTGIETNWAIWAVGATLAVFVFAYLRITLAAKVLAVLLVLELFLLLALDIAILLKAGPVSYDLVDFSRGAVFSAGLGIAVLYGFSSMIGIESTAIYQEEVRDRKRTIPLATFAALFLAGGFYVLTSWSLSTAVGSSEVAAVAVADPGHFVFGIAETYLGGWVTWVLSVLVLTSLFAASLGLYNNAARYLFALARDGVLPGAIAKTHPQHHSPYRATILLGLATLAVMIGAGALGLDPLLNITPALVGIGSVGLMGLLTLTSAAIPVFFLRRGEYSLSKTAAPVLGGIIILIATYTAVTNYGALTGVDDPLINGLIWVVPIVFIIGLVQAAIVHSLDADRFELFGRSRIEE